LSREERARRRNAARDEELEGELYDAPRRRGTRNRDSGVRVTRAAAAGGGRTRRVLGSSADEESSEMDSGEGGEDPQRSSEGDAEMMSAGVILVVLSPFTLCLEHVHAVS
jgi:hypothetical protein